MYAPTLAAAKNRWVREIAAGISMNDHQLCICDHLACLELGERRK